MNNLPQKNMLSPSKINWFTFFKLPASWWSGVRLKKINEEACETSVKFKWINQNPFKSMYFAVQMMAAELSSGALVMTSIRNQKQPVSMLVARNKAEFTKKATGRITFTCLDGIKIKQAIEKAIETKEPQTCWMQTKGLNEKGELVSTMDFEWTIKAKS
ncbi:DUF4442 domain-containing protein [Mesonia sp. MT50]|uniref:DUF4442 domain-containing protein n=1 Tax=Mesonia profundi TaxID=3070998 RepID=A0ABU1A202_9FLAO|nr:DUF4442 domain-containing protein [Mesonia profundi]MDQ7917738.1 DUF4442 domain-containing protein [Mesonia profundi]